VHEAGGQQDSPGPQGSLPRRSGCLKHRALLHAKDRRPVCSRATALGAHCRLGAPRDLVTMVPKQRLHPETSHFVLSSRPLNSQGTCKHYRLFSCRPIQNIYYSSVMGKVVLYPKMTICLLTREVPALKSFIFLEEVLIKSPVAPPADKQKRRQQLGLQLQLTMSEPRSTVALAVCKSSLWLTDRNSYKQCLKRRGTADLPQEHRPSIKPVHI